MMAKCFLDKPVVSLVLKLILMVLFNFNETLALSPYEHRRFSKVTQCPGQVISPTARYQSVTTRSVLECVSLCRPDTACASIVFDVVNNTCHLADTRVSENCSNTVSGCDTCKSYEKLPDVICENGGTRSPDGRICACPHGYYGSTCNITVADCVEYKEKGFSLGGTVELVFIKPPSVVAPFPVPCDYLPSPHNVLRTLITLRKNETANFNLSWQDYKDGFGDPMTNTYWMGLENLHHITTIRNYQLRFRVDLVNGTKFFQHYNKFVITDDASNYAFSIGHIPDMDLGDCLSELKGASFSTYDMDNDGSASKNCAAVHGGGWWFKGDNCSSCNPFGPIPHPFSETWNGEPGASFWIQKLGNVIPFKLTVFLASTPPY